MPELIAKRSRPFALAAIVATLICIVVLRLPETFLALLQRQTPLSSTQIGWAYRLLAFAAVAQAFYGGFVLLRPDHVQRARRKEPKLEGVSRAKLTGIVARTAASMILFTLIYGLAALAVSGQLGGFWLFPLLALAQGAWYYRQVGSIARWMRFQPETGADDIPRGIWQREPPDYCPPLVRGLRPVTGTEPSPET